MQASGEEIMKKCHVTGCSYTQVFTSGTDFPAECWVNCEKCGDYVVDELKEKK